MRLAVIARGATSPRASTHDGVVAVPRPRVGEGASLSLGMVIASADCPPGLPWAGPCRLEVLGGLMSPRG